jgi:hypothetical protein
MSTLYINVNVIVFVRYLPQRRYSVESTLMNQAIITKSRVKPNPYACKS